jgi:hypothetical protein
MNLPKQSPSRSNTVPSVARSTVTIGARSLEAILADLAPEGVTEAPPDGAFSTRQAMVAWRITWKGAKNRIDKLLAEGRIKSAGRFRSRQSCGNATEYYLPT